MTLSQLRHLIALAETRSFSRAAARLHLSQPALSRSIQALEYELGDKLFDRIGKRNELTTFGLMIAERARRVVTDASDLMESAAAFKKGGGTLNIGLGHTPSVLLGAPLMLHMIRHFPRARLAITRGAIDTLLLGLRERHLDALISNPHLMTNRSDLVIEPLPPTPGGFVCRARHPLAKQNSVTIEMLRHFPVVTTLKLGGNPGTLLPLSFGSSSEQMELFNLTCEDTDACLKVALNSDAIYFGFLSGARTSIEKGSMREIALHPSIEIPMAQFAIVTLVGRRESPLTAMFRRFAAESIA
jgi:DNA-binding transcriptional LysR family regulator